jgi:ribA/ribD-fused uncharacterized protein
MSHPRFNDLIVAVATGEPVDWLLFWGHTPPRDGGVGKSCLSQWWPGRFELDGEVYPTAEHWMMVGKARLFGDEAAAGAILATDDPAEAKRLGRTVRGYDEAAWRAARYDLVVRGNLAKFGQDPLLGAFLLATGERVLVEASPVDRIWGIGLAEGDQAATDPARWRGLNLLGFALMDVRDELARLSRPPGA